MGYDTLSIIEICGLCLLALWLVGFGALYIASKKGRREFRVKGFLRPPSGSAWFRFLLWKQYQYFENPSTRFCFGISHICMIGGFVVVMAVVLLLGSEFLLNGMSGFTLNSSGYISLPK